MNLERTVLLVSPTPALANTLELSLRRTGYRLTVARNYQAAKAHLGTAPLVLVTELKLGAHNGLQLALRTKAHGTRSVIVADKAFEAEIEQLGATWVSPEAAASGELPSVIGELLATPAAEAHWTDRTEGDEAPVSALPGYDTLVH